MASAKGGPKNSPAKDNQIPGKKDNQILGKKEPKKSGRGGMKPSKTTTSVSDDLQLQLQQQLRLLGPTGCTAEKCCNLFCDTFVCNASIQDPKQPASEIECPLSGCNATICWVRKTCTSSNYMCRNPNLMLKSISASITCDFATGCNDATCCEPKTCADDPYQCNQTIHRNVSAPNMVTCDTTPPPAIGCTENKCCQAQTCQDSGSPSMPYNCLNGNLKPRVSSAGINCDFNGCNDATCCEPKTCADDPYPCNQTIHRNVSAPNMVTCDTTGQGCTEAKCCRAQTCQDSGLSGGQYGCLNGNLKPRVSSVGINCDFTTGCNNATCCEPKTCADDPYPCNQTIHRNVSAPNMVTCDTTPPPAIGCTEDKCCQAQTCQDSGSPPGMQYLCLNGNVKPRVSSVGINCDFNGCNDATCCEPKTCADDPYPCNQTIYRNVSAPNMVTCATTGQGCTEAKCCRAQTCQDSGLSGGQYGCLNGNLKQRVSSVGITCDFTTGCNDASCCEPKTCADDPYQCNLNIHRPVDTPSMVTCDTTGQGCTENKCCRAQTCQDSGSPSMPYNCSNTNLKPRPNLTDITCLFAGCNDATCCEPKTCADKPYQCNLNIHRPVDTPSMVTCDTTGQGCTENKCCKAQTCQDSGSPSMPYNCSNTNLKPRPNLTDITCLFAGCNDATCCEPKTCADDPYQCNLNIHRPVDTPSMVTCDTTGQGCTENKCCKAQTCQDSGSPSMPYNCSNTNLKQRPNLTDITCLFAGCNDATCCEPKTCADKPYQCNLNIHRPVDTPSMVTCDTTGQGCTENKCCKAQTCQDSGSPSMPYNCSNTNLKPRPNLTDITCLFTGCNDATCCEPKTCADDPYQCNLNIHRPVDTPSMVTCDTTGQGCTENKCCRAQTCQDSGSPSMPYNCSNTNLKQRPNLTDITCLFAGCNDATCCEPKTCADKPYQCNLNIHRPVDTPSMVTCDTTGQGCTENKCCKAQTCQDSGSPSMPYNCSNTNLKPRPNLTDITCLFAGCNDATCCEPKTCADKPYACTSPGNKLRANQNMITCANTGCTEAKCCEAATCADKNFNCPCKNQTRIDSAVCAATGCNAATCCERITCSQKYTLLVLDRLQGQLARVDIDAPTGDPVGPCSITPLYATGVVNVNNNLNGLAYDSCTQTAYYVNGAMLFKYTIGNAAATQLKNLNNMPAAVSIAGGATFIPDPLHPYDGGFYVYGLGGSGTGGSSRDLFYYNVFDNSTGIWCKNLRGTTAVNLGGELAYNEIKKILWVAGTAPPTGGSGSAFLAKYSVSGFPSNTTNCTLIANVGGSSGAVGTQIGFATPSQCAPSVLFNSVFGTATVNRVNSATGATKYRISQMHRAEDLNKGQYGDPGGRWTPVLRHAAPTIQHTNCTRVATFGFNLRQDTTCLTCDWDLANVGFQFVNGQ
eukprot:g40047.t1